VPELDSKALLNEIIDGIGQPFYAVDAEWRFIFYNADAERHFGRAARDMIGKRLWDIFAADASHERGKILREAMAARKPMKGEAQSMVEGRIVSYCMFPLGNGLGVTFRDVTDRRRAEERRDQAEAALRSRTLELEAVLETIPTAVWFTYDRDLRRVIGNRRATELLRLPREADLSQTLSASRGFRVYRGDVEVAPNDRPLHRAARGEDVKDEILQIVFDGDNERRIMLFRAAPLRGPTGEVQGAVCAAADVTERHRYEEHLKLVLSELNHRLRNTLAIVQSIAALTFKGADAGARTDFEKRLATLSAVHGLLIERNWGSAGLRDIVRTTLDTHRGGERGRIHYEGDDLQLRPKSAVSVSMALHELATNAIKYGALSSESGRVSVHWTTGDGRFRLRWQEDGGPPVVPPATKGFGSRMIEFGLASELRGDVRISYRPEGVVCTIDAPLDAVREGVGHAGH
jgi:PAS domain S-box-containing protein